MSDRVGMSEAIASVMARYDGARSVVSKKKVGRPVKRTDAYLRGLLKHHRQVVAWYEGEFGCAPASDRQLYTAYFSQEFAARGERAGRAASQHFQSKLKTLRNELAAARQLEKTYPVNAAISGTAPNVE